MEVAEEKVHNPRPTVQVVAKPVQTKPKRKRMNARVIDRLSDDELMEALANGSITEEDLNY
jgi:hypothetical protein